VTALPKRVKSVDSHSNCLEPLADVVPVVVVEVPAQVVSREGSQRGTSIHENLCLGDIVFLGETSQERRPQKSMISDVRTRTAVSLMPRGQSRGG
jgi:hypothetical protein